MCSQGHLWVIVLAGGDGTRLAGATIGGSLLVDRPKQFCRFGSNRSLLQDALERASRVTDWKHIVPVVCTHHREWWESEFSMVSPENVLIQPANRGNALAIFHALIHILQLDADPLVALLPSDHAVEDEEALASALQLAVGTATERPLHLVLLGMAPEDMDAEYGWIVPATGVRSPTLPVSLFIEKPQPAAASELKRQGALWNSLIVAITGLGLWNLYVKTLPDLVRAYVENMMARGQRPGSLEPLYRTAQARDFARDVLEHATGRLRVLPVAACGWSDLGTPERLRAWFERRSRIVPRPDAGVKQLADPGSFRMQHAV